MGGGVDGQPKQPARIHANASRVSSARHSETIRMNTSAGAEPSTAVLSRNELRTTSHMHAVACSHQCSQNHGPPTRAGMEVWSEDYGAEIKARMGVLTSRANPMHGLPAHL